jgi:DNA polymerase-3 subunit gamma/tau
VLRLCDLLAVAVDDMRQGGDPRLPLELALVKVTRPAADMSHESLAYRLELLEARQTGGAGPARPEETTNPDRQTQSPPPADPPSLELAQLQEAWQRTVLPAVEQRSIPTSSMLREARPARLDGDTLTLEFPPNAGFHRKLAEDPKNAGILREALREVTGRTLALEFVLGEDAGEPEHHDHEPPSEDELISLLKDEFDAREVEEPA